MFSRLKVYEKKKHVTMEADKNKTYESYAALCFNFVSLY